MEFEFSHPRVAAGGQILKRAFDIMGAAAGLILATPILALISLGLYFSGQGNVIYRQARIGKGGKEFLMLKFCTMRPMAGPDFQQYLDRHPRQQSEFIKYQKLADDPRLTPMGNFLRRTSLDELPQLWNVLKGEMSLVGPRPFMPEQAGLYGRIWEAYTQVRPGITGLWQVSGRNNLSFQERVACDALYLSNWSLMLDISILLHTPGVVLQQRGAY